MGRRNLTIITASIIAVIIIIAVIDYFVPGNPSTPAELPAPAEEIKPPTLAEETEAEKPRARLTLEKPEERSRDFREVERGLDEDLARYEAMRCLRCDLEEK